MRKRKGENSRSFSEVLITDKKIEMVVCYE